MDSHNNTKYNHSADEILKSLNTPIEKRNEYKEKFGEYLRVDKEVVTWFFNNNIFKLKN